jgi:hypothetical protein
MPPSTEDAVVKKAKNHALSLWATIMGTIMGSGGINEIELSVKETRARYQGA